MKLDQNLRKILLKSQQNEIIEYFVYKNIAEKTKNKKDKKLLQEIAQEEKNHYNFWKKFTKVDVEPSQLKISFYSFLVRFFGINFGLRLMELGEISAQKAYGKLKDFDDEVKTIIKQEEKHEEELLGFLNKTELQYTGSIILGLNDALVEITGVLAGLTLSLQKTKLIAIVGLITGIAASFSMAGSEYLSEKEDRQKNPLQSGMITGFFYIFTVLILVAPYFIFSSALLALSVTVAFSLIIILIFTFYVSVAKGQSFKSKFLEVAAIGLGVAALNFVIGHLIDRYFHISSI